LQCGNCGQRYPIKDTVLEQNFQTEITPTNTKLITKKKKPKVYRDSLGNEINDETLLQDIARGATVISYYEQKSGEDKPVVVKK
jgi:hypothetical protein